MVRSPGRSRAGQEAAPGDPQKCGQTSEPACPDGKV